MKILIFNWRDIKNPLAGGAEINIHELSKHWIQAGHEVTLFCSRYPGCKTEETIDGVKIIRKGGRFTVYLYAFWGYITNFRKENFDVVIDDINGVPFFTPLYVKRPRISIVHHLVKDIFFKELKFPFSWLAYAAEQIMPIFYKKEKIVTVSKSSKEELHKFGLKNVFVIYNGVSNLYKPGDKTKYPTICYVGRIKKYKRLDILLDLIKKINISDLSLTIAGEGDALPSLKKLAEELNLKNVNFLGYVSEEDKLKLLQQSWLFVTPSEKEGWGVTVIEANACKTPVVAFNVPGLRDSIIDGKTGFLVNSADELKEKVLMILENSTLREKLAEQALEWSKKFSWEKSAEEFLKEIKK